MQYSSSKGHVSSRSPPKVTSYGLPPTKSASVHQRVSSPTMREGRYSNVWMITAEGMEQMEALDDSSALDTDIFLYRTTSAAEKEVEWDPDCWTLWTDLADAKEAFHEQVQSANTRSWA